MTDEEIKSLAKIASIEHLDRAFKFDWLWFAREIERRVKEEVSHEDRT
jgi:hypothetical protein